MAVMMRTFYKYEFETSLEKETYLEAVTVCRCVAACEPSAAGSWASMSLEAPCDYFRLYVGRS